MQILKLIVNGNEVRNSRATKSSYETELHKWCHTSSYQFEVEK